MDKASDIYKKTRYFVKEFVGRTGQMIIKNLLAEYWAI